MNMLYMDEGMQGYIRGVIRRELFRFSGYAFDDMRQEAYLCYCKVWNKYADRFDTPTPTPEQRKHFMGLFKTTFHNHLATLAWKCQYGVEVPISALMREGQTEANSWESVMPTEPEQATMGVLIATAPSEIKQLLSLLINDAVVGPFRKARRRHSRETSNRYYCRKLGLSPGTDLVGMFNRHFLGV